MHLQLAMYKQRFHCKQKSNVIKKTLRIGKYQPNFTNKSAHPHSISFFFRAFLMQCCKILRISFFNIETSCLSISGENQKCSIAFSDGTGGVKK